MRIRKKKWAQPELDVCPYYVKEPETYFGKWKTFFKNPEQKLELEIGCGKGSFVAQKAIENKDVNYLAVDIKGDMLGVARRTIEKYFDGTAVENIALIPYNVEFIDKIISKDDKVCNMYINFCNPWPRKKHRKRRLTFPRKLEKYYDFLTDDAKIYFKTDDDELFTESLEYFEESKFNVVFKTFDLHSTDIISPMTEHEKMFTEEGKKIKYLEATKQLINS